MSNASTWKSQEKWAHLAEHFDRPIAFQRPFVTITGSVTAALFLSQAVYWAKNRIAQDRDGWFYKIVPEWEEETGLSRREQESARRRLTQLGILEAVRRGVPARLWFRVDLQKLGELLNDMRPSSLARSAKLDCAKSPNQSGLNCRTLTKITSQTTTEITDKKKKPLPNGSGKEKDGGKPPTPAQLTPRETISSWNEIPDVKSVRVRHVNGKDRLSKRINARLQEFPEREWWTDLFEEVRSSDFLCGRVDGSDGRPPFKASLYWVLGQENLTKVLQGQYQD